MRRSTTLSAAVGGGLLAGLLLLGACGSGHSAQTATQQSTILGVNASSEDGRIAVRDAYVKYARQHPTGGNAPLVLRLFNEGDEQVTLTGVTAEGGGTVVVVSRVAPTPPPTTAPPATASASPNGSRRPSATPTTSAAPTSAAPTTPPALGSPNISIPIPARSFVVLVPGESDRWLALDKLPEPVDSGGSVTVTLTFTLASGRTITIADLRLPVGASLSPNPRLIPSGAGEH